LSLILVVALLVSNISAVTYSGGDGSAESPYRISDANNMNEIGLSPGDWDKNFVMINDINLAQFTGTQFNIIGTDWGGEFTGVFDGNDFTISNFTYESNNINYIGLFGLVDDVNAQLKDLRLLDPNIDGGTGYSVGALVGELVSGTISGCTVQSGRVSGLGNVGGLVGRASGSYTTKTITDCYSTSTVSGDNYVGGLVGNFSASKGEAMMLNCSSMGSVSGRNYIGGLMGYLEGYIFDCHSSATVSGDDDVGGLIGSVYSPPYYLARIIDCSAGGNVTATGDNVGGLVGYNNSSITDCYATGAVSGSSYLGGLIGTGGNGDIINCYATGAINGSSYLGGLCGYNGNGSISNCYATGAVSGSSYLGGLIGKGYNGDIINCYTTGTVSGSSYPGGLCGYDNGGTSYISCFWDNTINPSLGGIGNNTDPNVIAKSTTEMKTKTTFTNAGWDFMYESTNGNSDIWRLCEDTNGSPKLAWQFLLGDFVCPDGVEMRDFAVLAGQWQLEKLSSDVAPGGGDGIVNFFDWAVFANGWQSMTYMADLAVFADQWLQSVAYCADIAPEPDGDSIVNFLDFAALTENWLEGVEP
ncbi:MAG: hypothetical protein KAS75_01390, partial [Planctomycetes bacterium]|nr:hypothetical protein [Planctomycetota bacterium]